MSLLEDIATQLNAAGAGIVVMLTSPSATSANEGGMRGLRPVRAVNCSIAPSCDCRKTGLSASSRRTPSAAPTTE